MLVFVPNIVQDLPSAALAAVVIAASLSLVEVAGVRKLWRMRKTEFALSIICFLGVAFLGVIEGIFIAVGLALMNFIRRAWWPYDAVLGKVDGLKGYHDVTRYPTARRVPGLVLFRWDAPCSSPTPRSSPRTYARRSPPRRRRHAGSWWRPSRSPTWTPRPPT